MTVRIVPMTEVEASILAAPEADAGLGALRTDRGNLPLDSIDAAVTITGLVGRTVLTQGFRNPHSVPIEATYIFPLPDRAAVTAMRMTADDRVIEAELQERGAARDAYDKAIEQGQRASIAEQERRDVFTMRVGNILPGERVSVALTVVGELSYEDGEATYRLPLVVAPRYIPGSPMDGQPAGPGYADDTDAVPDASRITPPVLLQGFPNPISLSITVEVDPAGLPLSDVKSSLHTVSAKDNTVRVQPGERANRDFILRLHYGQPDEAAHALSVIPDAQGGEGTFRLTVLPPTTAVPPRPRDVVLLLDRSGSMQGWKMVAARRAAARIVDTLGSGDRFAVMSFDHVVERPEDLDAGLVAATDRHRFRAVRHLSQVDARGGTELLAPLLDGLTLLSDASRDRVLVLVTDGQVGNEDQILATAMPKLGGVRVHTVGIDRAVNAGFLGRLASAGGGRCELVESEDRLDDAMARIHSRIAAPVVRGLDLSLDGFDLVPGTLTPARLPDLYPGAPLVIAGRYRSAGSGPAVTVTGQRRDGTAWSERATGVTTVDSAATSVWARGHLSDLEDQFVSGGRDLAGLEGEIVQTSLRFGVLCRFTAWLAVDTRVVTEGGEPHRIVQPVEQPAGWDMPMVPPAPMMMMASAPMAAPSRAIAPPPAPTAPPPPAPTASPKRLLGFGGRKARRDSGPSYSAAPAPGAVPAELTVGHRAPDAAAEARAQLVAEGQRLREAKELSEIERREVLADLGTRLAALLQHLASLGADLSALRDIRALADELADDRPLRVTSAEFAALWTRAVALLP